MEQYKLNWIRRHLDPDSMAKYQHMQTKKRERSSERPPDFRKSTRPISSLLSRKSFSLVPAVREGCMFGVRAADKRLTLREPRGITSFECCGVVIAGKRTGNFQLRLFPTSAMMGRLSHTLRIIE